MRSPSATCASRTARSKRCAGSASKSSAARSSGCSARTAPATEIRYRENGREVVLETDRPTQVLHELTAKALAENRELEGLAVTRPTLEDVYLSLTGEETE